MGINRNMKFVKTLMTARALEQQEQKVVKKVMGKNKELKAALANEEEFNRLVEEAKKEGQEISKEMEKQIWEQAKQTSKTCKKNKSVTKSVKNTKLKSVKPDTNILLLLWDSCQTNSPKVSLLWSKKVAQSWI